MVALTSVNFFGHCIVARWQPVDASFVLGAMLPDFASMARTRVPKAHNPVVAAGIEHHHATDKAFHGAPTFLELMYDEQDVLEAQGLSYGSAMAVAHVGVELMLDGWLVDQHGEDPVYRKALQVEDHGLVWAEPEVEPRWEMLRSKLLESPLPSAYRDDRFVSSRMVRILEHRPRLALDEAEARHVDDWVAGARKRVHARASELMAELAQRLET